MTDVACDVRGLRKTFGERLAIENLSFTVDRGEVLALVGANGSGKSTTLNCLAGLLDPDAGYIKVGGELLRPRKDQPTYRARIAFAPDEPALYDDLTVRQQAGFVAGAWGATGWEQWFDDLMDRFGLADRVDEMPVGFSRGMRQKCGLAFAFLHPAQLVLVDEPYSGLDATGRAVFEDLIRAAPDTGAAIILATHALSSAAELADQAIALHDGVVVGRGSPEDVVPLVAADADPGEV